MLALTSLDVTFIFDSACVSASFGDKGCSVLQIFSKQQMSSVELSSYCSRCVFSQQFAYYFFVKRVKRSAILYHYQNNSNVLAPVVQTLDSTIHRINHYPVDIKCQGNQLRYPMDRFLSGEQRYPTFEQPGPDLLFLLSLDSLTKGRPSDGFFLNVEDLIRQAIRSFDYPECTIFKQLVQTIAPVEKVGR